VLNENPLLDAIVIDRTHVGLVADRAGPVRGFPDPRPSARTKEARQSGPQSYDRFVGERGSFLGSKASRRRTSAFLLSSEVKI
jgi:hypothetical protein